MRAFTPHGHTVAISALLVPRLDNAPVSIVHKEARRAIVVLAKKENRAVTDIVAELRPNLDRMQADWTEGYSHTVAGEAQETAETFGSAGTALMVAIIMIFGTLVLLFGSYRQAVVLLATLPLALIGTFLGFFIFGMEMSFFAVIGVITLMGIVANDAIVMIDTMNLHLKEGVRVAECAPRDATERLLPIISTSGTTIAGLVPLAIGNPMWRPLCYRC
nr:efflux RND transporter permease subunit [Endozoicomonas sp. G2_2]